MTRPAPPRRHGPSGPAAGPDPFEAIAALPGVAEAADAARGAVDRLRGLPAMRLRGHEVIAATGLAGARASLALDGIDVDVVDLRSGAVYADPGVGPRARGAVRVCTEIGSLAQVWASAPRQALARLHAIAAADVLPDEEQLGRPADAAAARRLDLICAALATPSTAPGIVAAAIVHAEIVSAAAFGPFSGVVGRGAARCVLMQRGVDPSGAVAPEPGHLELGLTEYQKNLAAYETGAATGVAAWVVHCARAVEIGSRHALRECARLR